VEGCPGIVCRRPHFVPDVRFWNHHDFITKIFGPQTKIYFFVIDEKITEETEILPEENTIYFCGFDSLEARKILWDKLKNFPVMWSESRIGRTSQRFYIIDLKNRDEDWITNYEKTLDLNGPRTELQCGDKGCFPSNAELVSKIIRQFVNIAEKKPFATHMISDWGTPPAIFIAPTEDVPEEINWD